MAIRIQISVADSTGWTSSGVLRSNLTCSNGFVIHHCQNRYLILFFRRQFCVFCDIYCLCRWLDHQIVDHYDKCLMSLTSNDNLLPPQMKLHPKGDGSTTAKKIFSWNLENLMYVSPIIQFLWIYYNFTFLLIWSPQIFSLCLLLNEWKIIHSGWLKILTLLLPMAWNSLTRTCFRNSWSATKSAGVRPSNVLSLRWDEEDKLYASFAIKKRVSMTSNSINCLSFPRNYQMSQRCSVVL